MKAFRFYTTCVLLCALPLSGCGSLYSNYREVEQLRVMQAMGLDMSPGGVTVTLAAAQDRSGSAPLCFSGTGESVSSAIEAARLHAVEEDLFTGHLKYILVGEEAARKSIDPYLSYICRSPDARMDMPLFILRGADAREAMAAAGNGEKGASEVLQAAHSKLDAQFGGHVFTAAEILRSIERSGSALVCALNYESSAEAQAASPPKTDENAKSPEAADTESGTAAAGETESEKKPLKNDAASYKTLSAGSYAIIKDGKLREFISPESALGVSLLTNTVGVQDLVVRDRFGAPVTLEINSGGTRLRPLWAEDGSLLGLEIYAKVNATVLEADSSAFSALESADFLTGQLEAAASDQIGAVLWLARNLEADFLGLAERIEHAAPLEYRRMGQDLGPLLPSLELSIAVQGELSHGHDLD